MPLLSCNKTVKLMLPTWTVTGNSEHSKASYAEWHVSQPCFALLSTSGLLSFWSPASVLTDVHLTLEILHRIHVERVFFLLILRSSQSVKLLETATDSTYSLCERCWRKFRSAILLRKFWHRESSTWNEQLTFNSTVRRQRGKLKNTRSFTLQFEQNRRVPSTTTVRPTRRKASSRASQGFPLDQTPQNTQAEKNWNSGTLWNP